MQRHKDVKGSCLSQFDLPARQGKVYRSKKAKTESTLANPKLIQSAANKTYGDKIFKATSAVVDEYSCGGFRSEYLTGTLLASSSMTPSTSRFNTASAAVGSKDNKSRVETRRRSESTAAGAGGNSKEPFKIKLMASD